MSFILIVNIQYCDILYFRPFGLQSILAELQANVDLDGMFGVWCRKIASNMMTNFNSMLRTMALYQLLFCVTEFDNFLAIFLQSPLSQWNAVITSSLLSVWYHFWFRERKKLGSQIHISKGIFAGNTDCFGFRMPKISIYFLESSTLASFTCENCRNGFDMAAKMMKDKLEDWRDFQHWSILFPTNTPIKCCLFTELNK